jgi:spore maturation protein CgeB
MPPSNPSILVIAPFDDAEHAHSAQRVRALERLGCDVTSFDLLKRPGLLGRIAGNALRSRILKAAEESEANLVIVIGGYELDEELVQSLRSATGIGWVNWFPDDLRMIDQALRVGRPYDFVFVTGSDVAEQFERRLNKRVEVLPLAADPSIYRPIRSKDQYRANVVFAGGATLEREVLLSGLVEFGLALWGPGWRKTALRDYCRGEVRTTSEFVRAYGGASVGVNLHHVVSSNGVNARCNQRVFELAAIGVPQVVDPRRDLDRYFVPGQDLLVFRDAAELRSSVERLIHEPPSAEALGESARRTALGRHTYMHRMKRVLDVAGIAARS